MAVGRVALASADGGLGYNGPFAVATWAAMGVASLAQPIAAQRPVVVNSAGDVETLVGIGPLRDLLVTALSAAGGTVIVMPLQRSTGGEPVTPATEMATSSGTTTITASGYALGEQQVILECVTGGAAGTAEFRLIVDGKPGAKFKPAAGDYGSVYDVPDASLGTLLNGVTSAGQFKIDITALTGGALFVAGNQAGWRMKEPKAKGGDITTAIAALVEHPRAWEWVTPAGHVLPATAELLHTAVRALPARGRYVHVHAQLAGHDTRTDGDGSSSYAAHVSGLQSITSPTRREDPRLFLWTDHETMRDRITGRTKVYPSTYPGMAAIARRESWQPPDATEYGALDEVDSIYPAQHMRAHSTALDNASFTTLTTYEGREGVYLTHVRPWTTPPSSGVDASDYYSGVERRRLMDEACRRAYGRLFRKINSLVPTDAAGRMTDGAKAQWAGEARTALRGLINAGALTHVTVIVSDSADGVLRDSTVTVTYRLTPNAKAEDIIGTVTYYVAPAAAATEAA